MLYIRRYIDNFLDVQKKKQTQHFRTEVVEDKICIYYFFCPNLSIHYGFA